MFVYFSVYMCVVYVRVCVRATQLYMGVGNLNSGPCTYIAVTVWNHLCTLFLYCTEILAALELFKFNKGYTKCILLIPMT